MNWNQDDQLLLMLYGEDSLQHTIESMQKIKDSLGADETELDRMLTHVIQNLQQITESEFARIGA